MDWNLIGAIAEAAAAIGVLVTLIYLAVQLRQTKKTLLADSRDQNLNNYNLSIGPLIDNYDNAKLWIDGMNGVELDEVNQYRFRLMLSSRVTYIQLMYLRSLEVKDIEVTQGIRSSIAVIAASDVGLQFIRSNNYRDSFKEYVENVVENGI